LANSYLHTHTHTHTHRKERNIAIGKLLPDGTPVRSGKKKRDRDSLDSSLNGSMEKKMLFMPTGKTHTNTHIYVCVCVSMRQCLQDKLRS
jgi:hypothetical protein